MSQELGCNIAIIAATNVRDRIQVVDDHFNKDRAIPPTDEEIVRMTAFVQDLDEDGKVIHTGENEFNSGTFKIRKS